MALLLAAAGVSAQHYKWVDRNGRVQYGDTPPPGASAQPLRVPARPAAPAAAQAPEAPAAGKRREEAEKGQQKQAKAEQEAKTRKDNCERAQASARVLESGRRLTRTDANGERSFLDEEEIAKETARVRQMVQEWCG